MAKRNSSIKYALKRKEQDLFVVEITDDNEWPLNFEYTLDLSLCTLYNSAKEAEASREFLSHFDADIEDTIVIKVKCTFELI